MDKHFFEKRCHYSIRKFAIGAASVMIGASIFGANMVQAAETAAPSETEGSITHVQALDKLPDDLAAALEKADAEAATEGNQEGSQATEEGTKPASSEEAKPETSPVAPKPAEIAKPDNKPAETATPATKPAEKTIEDREDVNHLEGATAQASNHETGTSFTADKAVDGDNNTRWATDRDVPKPTFELTLPKTTLIKHVEIDWDRRLRNGQNDPNIKSWSLYYAGQEDVGANGEKQWKLAHTKTGDPVLDEKVDLAESIKAKYLKLEVNDYQAGTMGWRNVGIQEIRAYSNVPDHSKVTDIRQVNQLDVAEDGKSLVLPNLPGQVSLIGSNKQGVIDLQNRIYQPLTDQRVKVMVQQIKDSHTFTKEFEVVIKGLHQDEGVGVKPKVAPAVQQWYGKEGQSSITSDTVLATGNSGFDQAATFYQSDLASRGLELATGDKQAQKRIEFKKVENKGYGKEGYGITIQNNVITIEAATNTGAFYATRTLLQMGETDLQNGEIRDFPSFSHRGFMLDTGRKFIPYDTLVDIMLNMAYYKMNDLQLHLNDNYIFLKEHLAGKNLSKEEELKYVLEHAKTGFRVETDIVGKNGQKLTSDEHYTKEEMQNLIKLAKALHINLVPEIDTPGHALSFVKVRPDLMYQGSLSDYAGKHNVERVAMLDLDNKYEETLKFVKSVYDKLLDGPDAPLHGVSTVHIGTDEYYGSRESYRRYVNDLIKYIKGKGYTPRIWGSLSAKRGNTPVDWNGVEVDIWSISWQRPNEAIAQGAKIINITDVPTYSVPSGSNSQAAYGDYANYERQYNSWTPNDFRTGGGPLLPASHPSILGGGHAVWNDNIDLHETGLTSYDIFKRFFKSMQTTAERTWGSDRAAATFAERTLPTSPYAPQSNPEKAIASEELFNITPDKVKEYATKKVTATENGLAFEKDSSIEGLPGDVGPSHVLKFDVTITGDGEQTFSTSGDNRIYLADKDGYLAYQFEQFHIQFKKKLEKNKRYQVSIVTKPQSTEVYVDGEKIERIADPAHPRLAHTSLVLPLESIGGFKGILHSAELTDKPFVNPRLIANDKFTATASSQELPGTATEGAVEKAFDNDPNTFWHTKWTGDTAPYTLSMTLKEAEKVNGLTYLPRPGGGNGVVTRYEIYAQKDGQMVKVSEGNWDNNAQEKTVNFAAVHTNKIELKVLEGVGGFASAAEVHLLKPVKEEQETPAPSQPEKPTTPEKPKVDQTGDGTVELADQFTASKPASEDSIAAASKSADYLKKEYKVFPTPQKVTYGEGVTALRKQVNLVMGDQLDIYTRNRLKSVLQDNQVSYTTGKSAVAGATNIYLGVHGQGSQAEQNLSNVSAGLFDKIDAYALTIKDNSISIVGKDTDAVFYGLTTLKHMLKESQVPVLRNVTVEDYAELKNRGFIEGYYGNPWSNADRAELMRYGGDLKLNQYFFAPKDDPYHNKKWRELYPEEKLAEIRELARVGNQSKTRYVWTIHPFMNNRIRFGNEAHYQEDLATIKAKFTQLMKVGVREFGILADDAPSPVGGYNSYNRLMQDMTKWLTEMQGTYSGLRKEMIFVPGQYWGNGREDELKSLNENLPSSTSMTLTGGKIWGEVSESFLSTLKNNLSAGGKTYRPVSLWINWPVTDNSKQHLILGGGEKFLHPNVDPSLLSGIMLNPMQQSEPSKIALFSGAQYSWKQWKSEEEAKKINDIAFNFVENGHFEDSKVSAAFRELGKHMINQNMDNRVVKLEESVDLAPKLTDFMTKLKAGQDVTAERAALRAEFAKIKEAAELYKASGDKKMVAQIHYWLDNAIDQMNALDAFLTGTEAMATNDAAKLWDSYYKGLKLYEQSQTHTFHYVDHMEKAELGVQHIRPFILSLKEVLASEVQKVLHPDQIISTFITNRTGVEGGLAEVTDGDLATHAIIKSPNSIKTGDYIGMKFNKPVAIQTLTFAMGTQANPRDTFSKAEVQYLDENDNWVTLKEPSYVGNESLLKFENLTIKAKAVRMIATENRENTWFAVQEIAVNRPVEKARSQQATVSLSSNLVYKQSTTARQITDGKDNTEAMMANADGSNTTPVDAWAQLDLGEVKSVTKVRLRQGTGDKLAAGVLEYSTDGTAWQELDRLSGEQTKEVTRAINARYIRVRNTKALDLWWRIQDFSVETRSGNSELTDTNVDSLKETPVVDSLGRYELQIPAGTKLPAHSYIGMKLDRIHQVKSIQLQGQANPALSLEYSANAQEWTPASQLTDKSVATHLVRYVRLVNKTDQEQAVTATSLLVTTKEVQPTKLESTTMGIHPTYGSNDVRKLNNLDQLFDGVYNNFVEFSDYAHKDGHVTLKLGSERTIKKIRAYIQDGTQNYLRDGKIQVSQDGKTWTDVVTVGDGVANSQHDDSLTDGWTHDSKMPGNRYIEGELTTPVKANYLRVLYTADYDARFVGFTELVINDGEFVKPINDPTVEGNGGESQGNLYNNLVDGKVLTSYKSEKDKGELVYHLSEPTNANHLRLVSSLPEGAKARVLARTLKDGQDSWTDLGAITSSLQTFAIRNGGSLLDVKLIWEGGKAEFYELASFYQELTEESVQSSKGEEQPPVLEVPEFTGGVNAVEALVHEVPEYTGPLSTAGDQPAPIVEKLEFTGGVNAAEAAVHEVPEYTGLLGTAGDQPAPIVEKLEFTGGVNAVEAAVHEVPEYTGPLGTAGDQPAPTVEKPEYKLNLSSLADTKTQEVKHDDQKELPATGESKSDTALFLAGVSLALSALFIAKGKKEQLLITFVFDKFQHQEKVKRQLPNLYNSQRNYQKSYGAVGINYCAIKNKNPENFTSQDFAYCCG